MPEVKDHRSNIATDPLRNFKFLVQIHREIADVPRFADIGFMSVSGLNASTEIIPYREGGNNTSSRKLPGQTNYSDITLTNGLVLNGHQLWYWFRQIFHVQQGKGLAAPGADFRSDVDIHLIDHPVNDRAPKQPTKALWKVYNAWPSSLAYSDLDSGGNAVLVQQMVLAHEGWDMHLSRTPGTDSVEDRT